MAALPLKANSGKVESGFVGFIAAAERNAMP
jgi:hypothetical protein